MDFTDLFDPEPCQPAYDDRAVPISRLNDDLSAYQCTTACLYGMCNAPRSYHGCGGCCGCMAGCVVEEEMRATAPFLWEGDYS